MLVHAASSPSSLPNSECPVESSLELVNNFDRLGLPNLAMPLPLEKLGGIGGTRGPEIATPGPLDAEKESRKESCGSEGRRELASSFIACFS